MNWSKIKTIMIGFLFVMNIFMALFIFTTSLRESAVPQRVIDATVEVLERDGFTCKKETIPSVSYKLPVLDASFYSASDLSDMLFRKQLAFRTEENSLVASESGATLTVTENYFTYKTSQQADKTHSYKNIKKALEKAGFDMTNSVYDENERCFYKMYKKVNLFNMYLKAELDQNGTICEISAQWPGNLYVQEDTNLTFVSSVTKLKDFFPDGGTIEVIEPGYSLSHLGNNRYLFTPTWRVRIGNDDRRV